MNNHQRIQLIRASLSVEESLALRPERPMFDEAYKVIVPHANPNECANLAAAFEVYSCPREVGHILKARNPIAGPPSTIGRLVQTVTRAIPMASSLFAHELRLSEKSKYFVMEIFVLIALRVMTPVFER